MCLSKIYRECGARYQKPQVVYKSKGERQIDLMYQQRLFSQEITRTLMKSPKVDIVYIDETTFNLWQTPSKMWLKAGMKMELPDQRGQSISMIGALSINKGLLHTTVFAGSNTVDTFLPFLLGLKEKCSD